jgi:predicted nuclease of predicted toxin-antitoxin system
MRILLDECLPARLRRDLPGHAVTTVPHAGWAGIKNGKLLGLIADSRNFDIFMTVDKNLPHQHQLKNLPFAVVILRVKSNRLEDVQPLIPEVLHRLPELQAGGIYSFPEVKE